LIESGAPRELSSPLLLGTAARFADPAMLDYIVSQGIELEQLTRAGVPVLSIAVQWNRTENVAWLVTHGAKIGPTDPSGALLINHAIFCRNQEVADWFDEKYRESARRNGISLDGKR